MERGKREKDFQGFFWGKVGAREALKCEISKYFSYFSIFLFISFLFSSCALFGSFYFEKAGKEGGNCFLGK